MNASSDLTFQNMPRQDNRIWRRDSFRSEIEAITEIEKETKIPCLRPEWHAQAGGCFCHVWCDICGDEIWIEMMRQVNVQMEAESMIIKGRTIIIGRSLHLCVECIAMVKEIMAEKAVPDIKEPEHL